MKQISRYIPYVLLLVLLFCFLPGCFAKKSNTQKKALIVRKSQAQSLLNNSHISPEPTITIWIHGTRLFPRPIFKAFFNSKPGLAHAKDMNIEHRLRTIADTLWRANATLFDPDHLYIFGWSGKLCFKERQQTAELLYNAIIQKIKEYHQIYDKIPKIRLICHSHGGNVALNLSNIHNTDNLQIEELIILACPVQQQTLHCIKDPLFKKIYALYSTLDVFQILDPQGLYKRKEKTALFSKRIFPPQANLAQIKVRLNGRALLHTEFVLEKFLRHLPTILECITEWQKTDTHHQQLRKNIVRILSIKTP